LAARLLPILRDQISFVLQDTLLFHTPISQNIAYGRPDANRAEIVRAAELANAHEFITDMPDGYDAMVGECGVTLSGGQRQRIAIARAVVVKDNQLTERGTHDELLAAGGFYAELYDIQFGEHTTALAG
jgi:ABC-type multidrug transport system fused ATPase/permease subunit